MRECMITTLEESERTVIRAFPNRGTERGAVMRLAFYQQAGFDSDALRVYAPCDTRMTHSLAKLEFTACVDVATPHARSS